MDRMPNSPRSDHTFDFFGTYLQTLQVEQLGDAMVASEDGIERVAAFIKLDKLAAVGISHQVRQRAQEKIDALESRAADV